MREFKGGVGREMGLEWEVVWGIDGRREVCFSIIVVEFGDVIEEIFLGNWVGRDRGWFWC